MNGNGKEYALAIFSIALENDNLETVRSDLLLVRDAICDDPDYLGYLISPAVPKSERLLSIAEIFEEYVEENVFAMINVLCEHGDILVLSAAVDEFVQLYEDYMNFAKAVVTSAIELSDEQKDKIVSKLSSVTGKKIQAEYIIDESIMGGVTVMVDGKYYDGSVRKNLNNLKEVMS